MARAVGCAAPEPATDRMPAGASATENRPGALTDESGPVPSIPPAVVDARRALEHGKFGKECTDLPDLSGAGWAAWLRSWCHLRHQNWRSAEQSASRALRRFESTGAVRRQAEMHLVRAVAGRGKGKAARAQKAARLFELAQLTLHGPVADPFAGDLPYLMARATRAGIPDAKPFGPGGRPATSRLLLRTAAWNYRTSGLGEALFSVDIEGAQNALGRGRIDLVIARLDSALKRARRSNDERQIQVALGVFADLADRLGLDEARAVVSPWATSSREGPPGAGESLESFASDESGEPGSDENWLLRKLDSPTARRTLANTIQRLRSDPNRAIRPPARLVGELRERDVDAVLDDGSWHLAHQAGMMLGEQGFHRSSRRYLVRAVSTLNEMRAHIPDPSLRQTFFSDKRPVFRALVDAYVGVDTENLPESAYRRALRTVNGLKARGLIDLLRGLIAPEQTVEPRDFAWREPDNLLQAADQIIEHLEQWRAGDATAVPPDFAGSLPDSVVDRLPSDAAVVEYMMGPSRSYVWVLTRDGMTMRHIAGREILEPLVDAFLETLVRPKLDTEQRQRHRRIGERLYVELLGPIEDIVVEHRHLVLAADEALYRLPFEALLRPMRGDRTEYVAQRHVVSYTPSSAALSLLAQRDREPAGDRALVLGSPELSRPAIDLLAVTDDLPKAGMFSMRKLFPKLPGSRRELGLVADVLSRQGAYETTHRTGARATEHFLRTADLDSYRLIHLTTHGVSDARPIRGELFRNLDMRQPALMLTQASDQPEDGVVTLGEILSYQTRANLVVLSGCTTGRGWRALGDGAYGLAGAFLYSGSRNVIASTWNVSDRDTTELMKHVYRALAGGASPPEALHAGQTEMLAQNSGHQTLPPYYWAGFRLIGSISH